MWNLTPDYIQEVKEELKGRRAAVEARYAEELKTIAADLDEIEQLERIAYAFAVKHLPDPAAAESAVHPTTEPAEQPEAQLAVQPAAEMAELQAAPVDPVAAEPEVQPPQRGGLSRWRMRLDGAEAESA